MNKFNHNFNSLINGKITKNHFDSKKLKIKILLFSLNYLISKLIGIYKIKTR